MFAGVDDEILFVCRQDHLDNLDYVSSELLRISPESPILSIKDWKKHGPAHDVLSICDLLKNEPTLISYCDYYMHWDYAAFKKQVDENGCDGAIPCYTGFHPHLLPADNLYATCNVNASNFLIEIREKFSWHSDKTKDLSSPGLYYFKNIDLLRSSCEKMISRNDSVGGELYMSLPFNYLVGDGLKVWCPPNIKRFCQWGTPEDMREHTFWIDTLRNSSERPR